MWAFLTPRFKISNLPNFRENFEDSNGSQFLFILLYSERHHDQQPIIHKKTELNIFIQIRDKKEYGRGTMITEIVDPNNTSIAMLKYLINQKYQ